MDDVPLCPPWWARVLWDLHFIHRPWPGPGPVNYPPAVDDIMAGLTIHTMSYQMLDQEEAQQIRNRAQASMLRTVENLSRLHAKNNSGAAGGE